MEKMIRNVIQYNIIMHSMKLCRKKMKNGAQRFTVKIVKIFIVYDVREDKTFDFLFINM